MPELCKYRQNSLICAKWVVGCKYRNLRGRKRINSLTIIYMGSPLQNIDKTKFCGKNESNEKG